MGRSALPVPQALTAMRRLLPTLALLTLPLLAALPVPAAGNAEPARQVRAFYGYAFDEATGRYLYTEVHRHLYEGGRWVSGTTRYVLPDGRLLGEKVLDFHQDPYVPLYRLKLPAEHYEEAITSIGSQSLEAEKVVDGQRERATIDRVPGQVADAGFHSFLMDHLDDLRAGRTVQFPFVVAGRLTTYRFRVLRTGESRQDGHPVLALRGEADSLLRLVAPSLTLRYDLDTHYLLEYHGVSNVHDPATGKAYPAVRIVFPPQPPAGVPATLPPLEPG